MSGLGLDDGETDLVVLADGTPTALHGRARCAGVACPVHAPSHHPLRNAPLYRVPELQLMMRRCVHDSQYPDPDSLAYLVGHLLAYESWHACCSHRCCTGGASTLVRSGLQLPARRAWCPHRTGCDTWTTPSSTRRS